MKNRLKPFLKRWPKFYNFIKKWYFEFREIQYKFGMRLLGTRLKERYWAKRHLRKGDDWGYGNSDWVRGYWDSRNHPHRSFLVEKISKFLPSSILEIGCNCGPNLYLLAEKFPRAEIVGVDINPIAVQKGNEWLVREGISNVRLLVGKADELSNFEDKSIDILFTDAVLMYIGPDKIMKVIKEMARIARRALVLVEWHYLESGCRDSRGLGVYHCGAWKRDYVMLLRQFAREERIVMTKITQDTWPDRNWSEVGAIIEVILE